jgi:hypothetical protein
MAKAWPGGANKFAISVVGGLSVGAITGNHQRVAKMGLIQLTEFSYEVVPAYVRGTSVSKVTYHDTIEIAKNKPGICSPTMRHHPANTYFVGGMNLGLDGQRKGSDFKLKVGGTRLSIFSKFACYNSSLKHVKTSYSTRFGGGPYYYKKFDGYFATFFTYEVLSSEVALSWVKKHSKQVAGGSTTAVFNTATDEEDRKSGGSSGLLHIQMQAALDANADYKNARYHQGNADPRNNSDIPGLVTKILTERGYTADAIRQFLNPTNTGGGGGVTSSGVPTTGNGNPTGQNPTPNVAPTPAITKVIVRAPYGYSTPPAKAPDTRPQIVQNYVDFIKDPSTTSGYKERAGQEIFHFPYAPNNVSYSGLGSEWTNIDRQGNYPLVEWAKWQLMRVELEFLLAEDRLVSGGAKVPDGIFVSVQNRLNVIRRMAQRQAPVSVFNLDDLFRVQVRRAAKTGKAMQFVIADMNVKSSRRSMDSIEKEITSATVRLTLQEMPVENITIAKMSPPQLTDPVIPRKAGDGDGELTSDPLWWSGVQPKLT